MEFMERVVPLQGEALRQRLSVVFLGEMEGADPPEEEGEASVDVEVHPIESPFAVLARWHHRQHASTVNGFGVWGLGFRKGRGSSQCDQGSS